MIRSISGRGFGLASAAGTVFSSLLPTLLLPANLSLSVPENTSQTLASEEVVVIDHESRRNHAREILGVDVAVQAGADRPWTDGAMEQYILNYLRIALRDSDQPRAETIAKTIIEESKRHDLDPVFVMAVIQRESRFDSKAVGGHGEIGMMQIKPSTARWISEKFGLGLKHEEALYDPVINIRISTTYMAMLRDSFRKDAKYYIAAYNMGPTRARALRAENVQPTIYAGDVIGFYRSHYHKLMASRRLMSEFTISMNSSPKSQDIGQISN